MAGTTRADLIEVGRALHGRGWTPATSGNFSARLDDGQILVTASGKDKGALTEDDFLIVNEQGEPRDADASRKPSAETLLHTSLYKWSSEIQVVLHTHSVQSVSLTRRNPGENHLTIGNLEILKAFPGIQTHEVQVRIPIFENTQEMAPLAEAVNKRCREGLDVPGYLIRGHGLYAWGHSVAEAKKHIEAFEYLLECELTSGPGPKGT